MKRETIRIFDDAVSANLWRVRLESEGIECFIEDEHIVTMNPLYNYAVGGIKLKVHERDVERAIEIIEIIEDIKRKSDDSSNDNIVRCPHCGSRNFSTKFQSMSGIKGVLSTAFSFVFTLFPKYSKAVRKCKKCDHEF